MKLLLRTFFLAAVIANVIAYITTRDVDKLVDAGLVFTIMLLVDALWRAHAFNTQCLRLLELERSNVWADD